MFTIYKITNIKNSKIYIGQTSLTPEQRLIAHISNALDNNVNTKLARAIRKYGKDSFITEQIDIALTQDIANKKEIHWIKKYNSTDRNIGYNMTIGGEGGNTYICKSADELNLIKKKISIANTGVKNGNATQLKCKNLETGQILEFGSNIEAERFFINKKIKVKSKEFLRLAKINHIYHIEKVWNDIYIFSFKNDNFSTCIRKCKTASGTYPYKITNLLTGEEYVGLTRSQAFEHFNIPLNASAHGYLKNPYFKNFKVEKLKPYF